MFQKQTFGAASTGFGSFNATASTASPFSGFKPTASTSAFGAPPAFGANSTTQPATGGDPKCQLLTPIAILNKIDTMCLSDPTGIARSARQALAQLEACSRHVRFDDDVEVKESPDCSDDDAEEILQCCLKTMSHGFHVVLITRSFGLQLLAEIRGVYVYDVQEIKRGVIKNKLDGRNIVDSNRQVTRTHNGYLCIRYTPARPPAIERNAAASERRRRNLMRHISFSRN